MTIIVLCEGITDFVFLYKIVEAKKLEISKDTKVSRTLKDIFNLQELPKNCCRISENVYMLSVGGKENFRRYLTQLKYNLELRDHIEKIVIVADRDFKPSKIENFRKEFKIYCLLYDTCLEKYLVDLIKDTEIYRKVDWCYEFLFSKKINEICDNIEFKRTFSILHAIFSPKDCFPNSVSKICEKYRDRLINLKIAKNFLTLITTN